MSMNFFGRTIALFTVPTPDLRPAGQAHPNDAAHERLVAWLNALEQEWEGDEYGLLFFQDEGGRSAPTSFDPGSQVMAVREDSTAKWRFILVAPPR